MPTYDAITVLGVASDTTTTSVTNTVTETTLASAVLPADIMSSVGRNLHIRARGTFGAVKNNNVDFRVKLNGDELFDTTAVTFTSDAVSEGWSLDADVTTVLTNVVEAQGVAVYGVPPQDKANHSWAFVSPPGGSGTFFFGGYYAWESGSNDFNPSVTLGTTNVAYAAHVGFVQDGSATVTGTTITVTGLSIQDDGTLTAADTETIFSPTTSSDNDYYETSKKFLGQVTIEKTAGNDLPFNYGWVKYWDNENRDFTVTGIEATWLAGASDSNADITLVHHKTTGWTAVTGGTPLYTGNSITNMRSVHVSGSTIANGQNGAFKRTGLDTDVSGSGSEGTIIQIDTGANNTFEQGNFSLSYSQPLAGNADSSLHFKNSTTISTTLSDTITLDLTVEWSVASTSNDVTIRTFQCDVGGLV